MRNVAEDDPEANKEGVPVFCSGSGNGKGPLSQDKHPEGASKEGERLDRTLAGRRFERSVEQRVDQRALAVENGPVRCIHVFGHDDHAIEF